MLKAPEKWRIQGAIGFGLASHWLKNWREIFKPITKHSNRNRVIALDSHLKTALLCTDFRLLRLIRMCMDPHKTGTLSSNDSYGSET